MHGLWGLCSVGYYIGENHMLTWLAIHLAALAWCGAGLYVLRHPVLRGAPAPSVLPFFLSRLSSLREHVV